MDKKLYRSLARVETPRSRRLQFERLESRIVLSGSGLTGQYFHNADHTGLALERVEAVDFNWGASSPAPGVDADSFSVRWTGQVEAIYSETYVFRTSSDERVRLWVDGQLLIDNWNPHAVQNNSATIALVAGQKYDLRLDYSEGSGAAQVRLFWSSPTQSFQIVPADRLYASPSGLHGEYTDENGGSSSRIDGAVAFDWGAGSPIAGVTADNFQVRWTGQLRPDFSESYDFSTLSDDGVRLWIGQELIIDDWNLHAATTSIGSKILEAGKWYDVRLEYFEGGGNAQIELKWSSERQTGVGQFETIDSSHLLAAKLTALTFTNPLGSGADPFVVQYDDTYLLVRSSYNSVWIDQANQLQDVHVSSPASATTLAWTPPPGTNYSKQVWAPELHQIDGKWYIYVAASDGNNATHRMHVLERDDPNPMGPYAYKGQLSPPVGDNWAIDGTILQWDGKLYTIWSGWPGATDGQQNLYIAEMADPWTLRTARVLLSSPDFNWERHGLPINEGPQILINDGQLHVIYSASGYWRDEYALGRLTYDGTGNLLDPSNWSKSSTPVFKQAGDIVGTGHASFTKSPDGTQDWIVYHAHHDANNWQDDRDVLIQPFEFNGDGTPNFGSPLPKSTVIEAPTGFAAADRALLLGDFNADRIVNALDYNVLLATFGHTVFPGSGADASGNGIVDAADITLWGDNEGRQVALPTTTAMLQGAAASVVSAEPGTTAAVQVALAQAAAGETTASYLPLTDWSGGSPLAASDDGASSSYRRAVDEALLAIAYDRRTYRSDVVDRSHRPPAAPGNFDGHVSVESQRSALQRPRARVAWALDVDALGAAADAWGTDEFPAHLSDEGAAS